MNHSISCDLLTQRLTFFLNSALLSLHSFAASTLAGDSSLGPESIDIILNTMLSTCNQTQQRQVHIQKCIQWTEAKLVKENEMNCIPCEQGSNVQRQARIHQDHHQEDEESICKLFHQNKLRFKGYQQSEDSNLEESQLHFFFLSRISTHHQDATPRR